MGRKGGGRAGFMKASRKGPDSDEEEEVAPKAASAAKEAPKEAKSSSSKSEPAQPVISKKAAAFLLDTGDGSDDSSDEDNAQDRSASGETRGHMQQRHKREAKAMKDQVKRLGKKGKDEAAKLEAEMKSRHATELASLAPAPAPTVADAVALADSLYSATLAEGEEGAVRVKKPTKAQRRREQKAKDDAEREARIAAENEELGETERMAEEKELKKLLAPLGLAVKDIPPDGHCLYRSLEDQMLGLADGGSAALAAAGCEDSLSFLALRTIAADHMRANADHFRHFIGEGDAAVVIEGEGDAAETAYEAYCNEVETTAAWGGHVEIEALSRALKTHIQVFSVGLPVLEMGEEFKGDGRPTLQLCYLRHAYGLGEHYNSVMQRKKRVTFEGESDDEDDE